MGLSLLYGFGFLEIFHEVVELGSEDIGCSGDDDCLLFMIVFHNALKQ